MKMMIVLIVIVAFVGHTLAGPAPFDMETLIDHSDESETLSKEQLIAKFDEIDLDSVDRDASVSGHVAELLYETADKVQTAVFNGVTVAELIKQNTIRLTDCNQEGFKQRTELVDSMEPSNEQVAGAKVVFGLNVYALRCLHLAADYCLRNQELVIKQGVSDDKFMADLKIAQSMDSKRPEDSIDEDLFVYIGIKSIVEPLTPEMPRENVN